MSRVISKSSSATERKPVSKVSGTGTPGTGGRPGRDPDAETRPATTRSRPSADCDRAAEHVICITRQPSPAKMTARVGQICRQFGVDPTPGPIEIVQDLVLKYAPGTITLISGPSGSGNTHLD